MPQTKSSNAFKAIIQQAGQAVPVVEGQGSTSQMKETGRRNRPGYTQVAAYIPAALYKQVKVKLLQEPTQRNFSELVETLLTDYSLSQIID